MLSAERGMFDRVASGLLECQDILLHNAKQPLVPVPVNSPDAPEALENNGDLTGEGYVSAEESPASAAPAAPTAPTLSPPYLLVRVLEGMDTFMGVDGRIYTLAKGDVVTLPERNASVLSDRNLVCPVSLPSGK